jgi:hypothetical protein
MKWQAWVLGIVGALIVSAIGGVVTATFASGKADAATEVRVSYVEKRVDTAEQSFGAMRILLERIDQRSADMDKRMERVEKKLDEAPKRRTR